MSNDNVSENQFTARLANREAAISATAKSKVEEYREARHWRWHGRHGFLKYIHETGPETILDFGCGNGQLLTRLALIGYDVLGIDLSPEMTDFARERIRVDGVGDRASIVTGDVMETELDRQFDLIAAPLIMHHLEIQPALEALLKCLKDGGTLVIWEPVAFSKTLQWLRDRSGVEKEISPNERQLNREDLVMVASRFEESELRYYVLVSRLRRLLPGEMGRELGLAHRFLGRIDHILFTILPPLKHFAGSVVMLCRGKKDGVRE